MFYVGDVCVGDADNLMFYGGRGGGIDIGSGQNVVNIAVVAVENRLFLSHLQRFIPLTPTLHHHVRKLTSVKAHKTGKGEKPS
jgi:hypothetical protein